MTVDLTSGTEATCRARRPDLEIAARNLVGRILFRAGAALHLDCLCAVSGWWDAGTDKRQAYKGRRCG
jgi:hypothetical protein